MNIETIMETAASYMEDFGLNQEAEIIRNYDAYPQDKIIEAFYTTAQYAQKLMKQRCDDADDLYMAVTDAKKAFMSVKISESKKKTVRLTESQLKRVISESVKQVISELDWKTYRNAAEKNRDKEKEYEKKWWDIDKQISSAHKRGDAETVAKLMRKQDALINKGIRTSNFNSYANEKFGDEFFKNSYDRFNANDGRGAAPFKRTDDGSFSNPEPYMDEYGNIHRGYFEGPHGKINGKHFDDIIAYADMDNEYDYELNGEDKSAYPDNELNKIGIPDNEINNIEKARREIRRYRNGDYDYTKGKGWHLKDKK